MIKGIGIDICSSSRIKKIMNKNKSSFVENTFSKIEIEWAEKYKNKFQFYASRFAAKEAFLKCLGMGVFNSKISLNEISIEKEENGKPFIKIMNNEMLDEMGNIKIHLSISHENEISTAFVVLESV